jgi:hypothetical protein
MRAIAFNKLLNTFEHCSTLMSCDPAIPKKACRIQRSWSDAASSSTLHDLLWPWYMRWCANGQFFHGIQ